MTVDDSPAIARLVFGHDVIEVQMTEQQAIDYMNGKAVAVTAEHGEPTITPAGQLGVRYHT